MKQAPSERTSARGLRVALLRSAFNRPLVAGLVEGARQALLEAGAEADSLLELGVPGAFELPLAAQAAARSGRFDAVVALGAVVTRAPAVTDLDQDPLKVIETGDWVKVDGDNGIVEVTKKGG